MGRICFEKVNFHDVNWEQFLGIQKHLIIKLFWFMTRVNGSWSNSTSVVARDFTCGYCGKEVASNNGYYSSEPRSDMFAYIYMCPRCNKPTFFYKGEQVPGELPGKSIGHLPEEIQMLYQEAQRCVSANSFTGCVLICRKILMHVGHDKGAAENKSFVTYISHLFNEHYITPDGKGWVDYIRSKGNEANHEILVSSREDALGLLGLTEMLLLNIYDMPNRVPNPPAT